MERVPTVVAGPIILALTAGVASAGPVHGFYAVENINERVIFIDVQTGQGSEVTATGLTAVNGIAYDTSSRRTYFTGFASGQSSWTLYEINLTSTLVGEVGPTGLGSVRGLARTGDGMLHTIAGSSGDVTTYRVDPGTGAAAAYGSTGSSPLAYDSAYDPITGRIWVSAAGSAEMYSLDPATGQATYEFDVNIGGFGVTALAILPDGTMYGVGLESGADNLYRIDRNTGQTTLIGNTGFDQVLSMTFVPTPMSAAPLALAALALRRRG